MDDFVAALLCLPFLILPSIVLVIIVLSKIEAFEMAKKACVAIAGRAREIRKKAFRPGGSPTTRVPASLFDRCHAE